MSTTRSTFQRFLRVALLAATVSSLTLVAPTAALAIPGEIGDTTDNNWVHPPKPVTENGKVVMKATFDKVKMECPAFARNCRLEARLANKGTNVYSTWYEQTPSITSLPTTGTWTTSGRLACGTHYWKVQSRITYEAVEPATVREYFYTEYGYTSEGSVGGSYSIFKFIGKVGQSVASGYSGFVQRDVQQFKTYSTDWRDADEAAGTFATSC